MFMHLKKMIKQTDETCRHDKAEDDETDAHEK